MVPLGVCAVIPPWNFPLAILVGMTTAALVAGNTVVLKPASDSPWIASKFAALLEEVRIPPGVFNFVPGGGADCGETIVTSPLTRLIAFTGSKDVGLHIHEVAAKPDPRCKWIKRTVLEMGGKDAILVDEDFDPEEAATYIVQSAYGFQGQKCSACSRAIVHRKVYDEVARLVVEKTAALRVGDARDPRTQMAAVVSRGAQKSILDYCDVGRKEGELLTGGKPGDAAGCYVQPTVFGGVRPKARITARRSSGRSWRSSAARTSTTVSASSTRPSSDSRARRSRGTGSGSSRRSASSRSATSTSTGSAPGRSSESTPSAAST